MELKHYLTYNGKRTTIDEPIGFDRLQTSIKRTDNHGMSTEVSVGDLEFYGIAYDIIKEAYEDNIDAEVIYRVVASLDKEVYYGAVDLSTCKEVNGDYRSITCKVGDIGVKTTFNNRTDTEVDLNSHVGVDGYAIEHLPEWKQCQIPNKHLVYTNAWLATTAEQNAHDKFDQIIHLHGGSTYSESYMTMRFKSTNKSEFGTVNAGEIIISTDTAYRTAEPLFKRGEEDEFVETYGSGTTFSVDGHIRMTFRIGYGATTDKGVPLKIKAMLMYGYGTGEQQVFGSAETDLFTPYATNTCTLEFDVFGRDIPVSDNNLHILVVFSTGAPTVNPPKLTDASVNVTMEAGSNIKMKMYDNIIHRPVTAPVMMIFEALNNIIEKVSDSSLSLKSDYYGRHDCKVNPTTYVEKPYGDGALKAITNGYKIRGLFTDDYNERNMPISFDDAIKSLKMMDGIGWGFDEANGNVCVRIERWDWFYQDNVVLEIDGVNELTRDTNSRGLYSEVKSGYKKYSTTDQYNSIDSVHGERTFNSKLKAVSNKRDMSCEFIADNYSIEEARRSSYELDSTEESNLDECIFVFEMLGRYRQDENKSVYEICSNVVSSDGVDRPNEQINVQLSPRRCAERNRDYLFSTNSKSGFRLTTGKINYKAKFQCNANPIPHGDYTEYYLHDVAGGEMLAEDATIEYVRPRMRAETLSFKFPIAIEDYKAILSNPYGKVVVNGVRGWIQEFTYSFADGEAEFKLIPEA